MVAHGISSSAPSALAIDLFLDVAIVVASTSTCQVLVGNVSDVALPASPVGLDVDASDWEKEASLVEEGWTKVKGKK